jgi:hypothetical protein
MSYIVVAIVATVSVSIHSRGGGIYTERSSERTSPGKPKDGRPNDISPATPKNDNHAKAQ